MRFWQRGGYVFHLLTTNLGTPTGMAANGLICVGTETGFIYVFDFKQNLT